MKKETDFLVIGSGISGLSFALKAAEYGNVVITTKKEEWDANTNLAQGGIAISLDKLIDQPDHIKDTMKTGKGIARKEAVEHVIRQGKEVFDFLIEQGIQFTKKDGSQYHLTLEGGHSHRRIYHTADHTGNEIETKLLKAVKEHPRIELKTNSMAIDLLTQHHMGIRIDSADDHITCFGAYIYDRNTNKVDTYFAKITMIASGGFGQVYMHTTNPAVTTGDGIAMAYRAGGTVANLEFVQFHPTAFYSSREQTFLISEAVRGEGGVLVNHRSERFMKRYAPERMELAPRDIVARAIDNEMKETGAKYMLLDISHKPAAFLKKNFPTIYKNCLDEGIDITKEPIPVVPATHYSIGGIVIDKTSSSSIENLYASGEAAFTGMHGANRLASNSLLEAAVTAIDGAKKAGEKLSSLERPPFEKIPEWKSYASLDKEEWIVVTHNKDAIKKLMWEYVGIVRSDRRLWFALKKINLISDEIRNFYRESPLNFDLLETRNMAQVAKLIIKSAQKRKESRGTHYNKDHPKMSEEFTCSTFLNRFIDGV